ncbi:MAG: Ig-like domain-containing protein [Patescibacteria group bacterium]
MKKLWLIIISLLLVGVLPLAIHLVGQRQEIRKKAAPATTLTVMPATSAKKVGDAFSIEITIDTGENQIVAVELHLSYDPTKLEAQTIANGPLFPNILASGTIGAGETSITVGAQDAKQPIKGTSTVAVITFKAKAKTDSPTAIKLSPNTFVGGLGEGATNVLVGTTPATVTISEAQLQSTPSPPAKQDLAPPDTLSPAPISTSSAQSSSPATPSAHLAIISPSNDSTATQNKPTITGKTAPGATVTITIYSTPSTVTVTADENGNWSFTPETALETGPHNIVASVTDQNGQTQTATSAFVVAASGAEIGGAAESVIPVSGTVETTILLIVISMAFIIIGFVIPAKAGIQY